MFVARAANNHIVQDFDDCADVAVGGRRGGAQRVFRCGCSHTQAHFEKRTPATSWGQDWRKLVPGLSRARSRQQHVV